MKPSILPMMNKINASLALVGAATNDLLAPDKKGNVASDECIYAAYLYALTLDALTKLGFTCVARSHGTVFSLRRHNGLLSDPDKRFSYVALTRGRKKFELHMSVYSATRSPGARLELDITIVPGSTAARCRAAGSLPRFAANRLFMEAKCYAGEVSTPAAKQFIGIWDRVGGKGQVSALISGDSISDMAVLLLSGAKLRAFGRVSPLSAHSTTEAQFTDFLKTQLPSVL